MDNFTIFLSFGVVPFSFLKFYMNGSAGWHRVSIGQSMSMTFCCVLVSFLVPGDCFCVSGFIGCDYLCCVFGFVCSACCFRFLGLVILVISGFCSHCNINCASYSYFFSLLFYLSAYVSYLRISILLASVLHHSCLRMTFPMSISK